MNKILISVTTETNNERDASNSWRFERFHDTIKDSRFDARLPLELCQAGVCRPERLDVPPLRPLHITLYLRLSLLAAVLHRTADHVSDRAYPFSILKCEHNNLLFHWSRAFFFLRSSRGSLRRSLFVLHIAGGTFVLHSSELYIHLLYLMRHVAHTPVLLAGEIVSHKTVTHGSG